MSQDVWSSIDPATTSGTQLATLLNGFKNAVMSGMTGTSRPSQTTAGGMWINTTNEGTPNFYWDVNLWTGSADIQLFRINLSGNSVQLSGSDNSFQVSRVSADAVGALMKLSKARIANSGQVLDGDVIGELQFLGKTNAGASPIVARIKSVASDDETVSAYGSYIVFEATQDASATLSEMMRLVDKKLGVGLIAPDVTIHALGSGIKSQRSADDTTAAKFIFKKKRVTAFGATQNSDGIAQEDILSTDDAGADLQVARVKVVATQNHTASAGGVQWQLAITKTGSVSLTDKILVGDLTQLKEGVSIEALILDQQDVATAASIVALSTTKSIVRFTGSTATSLKGIDSTGNCKTILIHNASTADITVKEADAGAAASDRFSLPNARDITVSAKTSIEFFYSTSESRWKLKSGSGSGGGGALTYTAEETISSGATITTTTVDQRQLRLVKGNTSGGNSSSATPFGVTGGWTDMTEIILVGTNDDTFLTIPYNDAAYGVIGNFSSVDLVKNKTAKFIWINALTRWLFDGGN